MIIKKLEIISFGKFKNKTIEFSDGLNIVCGNNESGKSTIISFIYAMLYGFGDNRGKSASLREKYTPWSGGECEGKLTALLPDGRTVTIYRKAGAAKKNDILQIYDAQSGQPLTLSSEDIVGVGSDTFLKTLCIRQMSSVFTGSNDEIVKRLSNISSAGDENINFEKAVKILDSARREIKPLRGNGGALQEVSSEISQLEHIKTLRAAMEKELENARALLPHTQKQVTDCEELYDDALKKDFSSDIARLMGRIEEKEAQLAQASAVQKSGGKEKLMLSGIIFAILGVAGLFVNALICAVAFVLCAVFFLAYFTSETPAPDTSAQENEILQLKEELSILRANKTHHEKSINVLKQNLKGAQDRLNSLNVKIKSLMLQLSENSPIGLDKLYEKKFLLEKQLRALTLAGSALTEAHEKMQRNFTPALNKKASEYFCVMTGGKYPRIFSDEQFNLTIDADIPRKSELFSGGTADQLYLSLRLALIDMIFDAAPSCIILDQPFIQYDALRRESALKLLQNMTNNRQILLFTGNADSFSDKNKIELLT